ncbi:MAG: glycine--tRNA ligase subunit beta, partial [Anaerolineaceae bacterium]|nr:glycine--tRNA ligase subunit beta [Anaerolineaceae bacterium]
AFFAKMRNLSRNVAEMYIEQRKQLEFPWVIENNKDSDYLQNTLLAPQGSELPAQLPFMFELGTEELPVDDLNTALEQLAALVPQLLENLRLEHGEVKILGTPRRLVVSVADLQTSQADRVVEFKGPPADRAFDADGNLTKAGEGFARSKGIDPDQLEIKDLDGGRYAVGTVKEVGKSTPELLTDSLPGLIASLKFNKPMRWNESGIAFSRPIRWLTAFLGRYPINFSYADIKSDTQTRGLRFVDPSNISITEPQDYYSALQKQGIILDQLERKQQIIAQVKALAEKVKGVIHDDPSLLDEVTNLVEQPTALLGNFDEKYLISLPAEVLISVMKKHQRYFPIFDDQGNLLPFFITIRNGDDKHAATVVDGNLQVILARFADAEFFIAADKERKLEDFIPDLAQLTFQKELGSMLDKTHRIEKLVNTLQKAFAMNEKESKDTLRAASLCKADLASNMVVEMTSLQGVMGKVYALESGEKPEVAEAILEHYLPRSTEDDIPKQKPGYVIGIADRLDTLAGLFSVGLAPTGTKDPFAQRRAALGLIQNLMGWDQDFDIKWGLEQASLNLPTPLSGDDLEACVEFVKGRLRGLLLDQGFRYDVVDAVLAKQGTNPAGVKRSVVSLSEWVERADWMEILPTFSRCVRITREIPQMHTVDTAFFVEEIERQLFESLEIAENAIAGVRLVDVVLNCFLPLMPLINAFFDTVLVMADDMKVRNNRLGLLQRIAALSKNSADMSYLEGF